MRNRYHNLAERMDAELKAQREKAMRDWLAEIERYPEPGSCYFIGAESGRIKIGCSRQPARRLWELRRDTVDDLKLLATAPGGMERERYYHRLFKPHHKGGEWFERCPEILAEIDRLSSPSPETVTSRGGGR